MVQICSQKTNFLNFISIFQAAKWKKGKKKIFALRAKKKPSKKIFRAAREKKLKILTVFAALSCGGVNH